MGKQTGKVTVTVQCGGDLRDVDKGNTEQCLGLSGEFRGDFLWMAWLLFQESAERDTK